MKGTLKTIVYAMGAMLAASSFLSAHGAVSVTASRTYVVQETTLHASETSGQNVLIYTLGTQSNKFVVAKDGLDMATKLTPVTEPGTTNVIGYYIGTNASVKVASSDWLSKVSGLNPVYGQGAYSSSVVGYTLGDDAGKVVASSDWLSKVMEVKPIVSSDDSPSRVVGYTIGTNAYVFASDKSVEVKQIKKISGSTTNVVGYTIGGNTNNVFVSADGVRQVIPNYSAVSNAAMMSLSGTSQISDGTNIVNAARNVYRISHNPWFMYKYKTTEPTVPFELYYQGTVAYSNTTSGRTGVLEDFYVSNRRIATNAVGKIYIGVEGSTTNVVLTHERRSDGVYPIIWSYPSSVSNGVIYAFNNGNTECLIKRVADEEVSTNFVGRLALTNDVVTLVKPGLITDGTNTIYASRKFVADSGEFEWRVTSGLSGTSHVLVGQKNEAQYTPENPQDGDEMWSIHFSPYEDGLKDGWWMLYVDIYSNGVWFSDAFYQANGNIDDTTVNINLGMYVADWVSSEVVVGKLALMSDFSTSNELLVATIESVSPKRDSDRITDGTNTIDAARNVYTNVMDLSAWTQTQGPSDNLRIEWMSSGEIPPYTSVDGWYITGDNQWPQLGSEDVNVTNITEVLQNTPYYGDNVGVTFVREQFSVANYVGKLALTNDIPAAPDFTTNNTQLVATIEAKAPAPGNYAAVSNLAMNARSETDLGVRGAPQGEGSWFMFEISQTEMLKFDWDTNQWQSDSGFIIKMNTWEPEELPYYMTDMEHYAYFYIDQNGFGQVHWNGSWHKIKGYNDTIAKTSQIPTKTSDLQNDGDGTSAFATVDQIPSVLKQDALPYPTNAIPYDVISGGPEVSPSDPTFSNAVLAVGLNIDTNTVAAINALVESGDDLPIGGATTVGVLILALAAAIAGLKRKKADKSELEAKLDSNSAAPAFDPTKTYSVGEHVTYDGVLYECSTAVTTAGAWTGSTNWTATDMTSPDATLDLMADGRLRLVSADGEVLWMQGYGLASASSVTLSCDKVNFHAFAAAPAFDATAAYAANDIVAYDGVVYVFTAAHAAGAWTGSDATVYAVALAMPTAPSGKVGDFVLDVDNTANASASVTATLTGAGTAFDVFTPEGVNLSTDILTFAGGEQCELYFSMTAFGTAAKPAWKVVKQIVEKQEFGS